MNLENILKYGKLKGLNIIGTGDCFCNEYLKEIKEYNNKTDDNLILTTEIEDKNRIHHLIILPTISKIEELKEKFRKYSNTINSEGRPKIYLTGEEILEIVKECEGLIGPAHAFTPYTSLYKTYNSIYNCYGKKPDFLELGLSANTKMANLKELENIPFLTNSDAHSYYPHRLGREFTQLEINNLGNFENNFNEIKKALKNNKIIANYGIPPSLGKYYLTACSKCYLKYKIEDAIKLKYKCAKCSGTIKKGVFDRCNELQLINKNNTFNIVDKKPPYYEIIPLAQIISLAIKKGINTKGVNDLWDKYIEKYNNEINILINININNLKEINENVSHIIYLFRTNKIYISPGGGGQYGKISIKKPTINWYSPTTTLDNWVKKE